MQLLRSEEISEKSSYPNPDVFVAGDLLWYPVEGSNIASAGKIP